MALKLKELILTAVFASLLFSPSLLFGQLQFDNAREPREAGQEEPVRPLDSLPTREPVRPQDDQIDEESPVQRVQVDERYAGWQEAGSFNRRRLSDNLRANWVMLDRNGEFSGTVRGVEGAEVAGMTIFVMEGGRQVKSAAVQADGSFVFTNMTRGAYSFVGWGSKAFFCFGANIADYNRDSRDIPRSMDILAFQNETTINTDWLQYFAPNTEFRVYGTYNSDERATDPPELLGYAGLSENPPPATASTSIGSIPVSVNSNGQMIGRVHQMNGLNGRPVEVRTTKVMLLKGDDVVGSTTTDNFGIFRFSDVPEGNFGLVAVSVDGVGAVGINVVEGGTSIVDDEEEEDITLDADGEEVDGDEEEEEGGLGDIATDDSGARPFDFCMVSSETVGWLNHFAREVAYRRILLTPRPPTREARRNLDPVCPHCNGAMGPGGCPSCGNGRCGAGGNVNCDSPLLTFDQWQAGGCANRERQPLAAKVGERLRDSIERVDERFERAFYGTGTSGSGFNGAVTGGNGTGGVGNGVNGSQGFNTGTFQGAPGFNQGTQGQGFNGGGFQQQAPLGGSGTRGFAPPASGSGARNVLPAPAAPVASVPFQVIQTR